MQPYSGIWKLLIEKNAKVDAADNDGWTALHHAATNAQLELSKWVIENTNGWLEVVKWLIEKNAKVDAADNHGRTVLHQAARYGKLEVVKWLIEKNAKADATDNDGWTALHHAAANWGQLEVVKWLIDVHGRLVPLQSKCGESALDVAKRCGKDEIQLLLSK
jgi:ankyrin repeat protein